MLLQPRTDIESWAREDEEEDEDEDEVDESIERLTTH